MRNSFVKQVMIDMKKDKNIFFLTGDLGFNALEPIRDSFPDRFINIGVAEANMIGVASGLALTGKKVIVYSIASFISLRCFEQIRTDVCYHNLDVKIFGAGGGYNYASHGITHHTVEDLAIMRALPNMKVMAPAYAWEAEGATKSALDCSGPTYMRLGKSPPTHYQKNTWKFKMGRGFEIKKGDNIVLICTGNVLDMTLDTAYEIEKKIKLTVSVISMPSIKPFDKKLILSKAKNTKGLFTIEEHSIYGGLGGAISEFFMETKIKPKVFKRFGIPDKFLKDVGNRDYLLKKAGLEKTLISKEIIKLLRQN